ncbi:mitochondrial distribution/morphology family 35/apoptosis [Flagelloscypha sp. PMI_526]|nr:mitochondrial distribution/morphology family 35/apoptosis [Flagelloscypha sp. PMI_526]
MADSLAAECTPLKTKYDSCFNAWFEGYLEPAVNLDSGATKSEQETRAAYSKAKAQEFQDKCGPIWNDYRSCLHNAMKAKGLDKLLDNARKEMPLKDPIPPPASEKN